MRSDPFTNSDDDGWVSKGNRRQFVRTTATAAALAAAWRPAFGLAAGAPGAAPASPLQTATLEEVLAGPPRGPWRRLFLDATVVEEQHVLKWKETRFPANAKRDDYKIRFCLMNAELFSYLPEALDPNQSDLARFPKAGP